MSDYPRHIGVLSRVVDEHSRAWVDHADYVRHGSPQSSIDRAALRLADAKAALDAAVCAYDEVERCTASKAARLKYERTRCGQTEHDVRETRQCTLTAHHRGDHQMRRTYP